MKGYLTMNAEPRRRNSYYLADEAHFVIARGLRKSDAIAVIAALNERKLMAARNWAMAKALHDCETTVERLRAFIKAGQLAQIAHVIQEPI